MYSTVSLYVELHEAAQLFYKCMASNECVVHLTNIRFDLIGSVGKTSFKSLLFKWPASKVHNSSTLATRSYLCYREGN